MAYCQHLAILVCIYVVLAVSLDLIVGHAGILTVAHAAFYGIGAYTAALFAIWVSSSWFASLALTVLVCASASLVISIPASRLHEDYLVISTFAFQIIAFGVFNNWMVVTRGPLGIPGIPPPTVLGMIIASRTGFLIAGIVFATITYGIVALITRSPFGRVLRAIREDERYAQSLGKNTLRFKIVTFAMSAALAGVAGNLYAYYFTYIDPTSFQVMSSILVLSMVILGGAGSRWGAVLGAFALTLVPEMLRFVGLPDFVAAKLREILYGLLLAVLLVFRPTGLMGRWSFKRA